MDKLGFEYPWMGLLLIVYIIGAFIFKSNQNAFYIPHVLLMPIHVKRNWLSPLLKWIGICMLVLALTSPFIAKRKEPLHLSHTIMMLIDVSNSMNGGGLRSNVSVKDTNTSKSNNSKFEIAKQVASQFAQKQANSNIGVIVFGDFAYVATPLTYDKKTVSSILEGLEEGIAGSMTAMYDALFLSTSLLKKNSAKNKVAILLTDGYNTAGRINLDTALRALSGEKIKVYTIGVGEKGDYDAAVLTKIALESGGQFFEANNQDALKSVYEEIDALERSLQRSTAESSTDYLFIYPLLIAFFSLLGYMGYTLKENR
ncbi:vWA domain-containing protein [Sulfurospirillum arcachonense]|uniref:vWA domain-containing protein n=1 Tax=Sulfurospirillum arcachonense TaxID=57666 RepID=UPI000467F059|nr:VWA domain-containing protein [Sulfurospirillum arcachonense]